MRDESVNYFIQIPSQILKRTDLTMNEKVVFGLIYTVLNTAKKFFMSNQRISEQIGMSPRNASRIISSLKKKGIINVHFEFKDGSKEIKARYLTISKNCLGGSTNNSQTPSTNEAEAPYQDKPDPHTKVGEDNRLVYKTNTNRLREDKKTCPSAKNADGRESNQTNSQIEKSPEPPAPEKKKIAVKKKRPVAKQADFEKLWAIYPRKEGKQVAWRAYQKAIRAGTTNKEIQTGIVNYCAYLKQERIDNQFIAMGSTWFNQRRWEDDYDIKVEQQDELKGLTQEEITKKWMEI